MRVRTLLLSVLAVVSVGLVPAPAAGSQLSSELDEGVRDVADVRGSVGEPVEGAAQASSWLAGIDVASWQHPGGAAIDWPAVRRAGQRYVWVKSTEGFTYMNPWYGRDMVGARNAGLFVGAYHYARPSRPVVANAVREANRFADTVVQFGGQGVLPPVLDLEEHGGLSKAELASWTKVFLDTLEGRTGRTPMIYTGGYFWNDHVGSTAFGRYPLWLANYTSRPQPTIVPMGWRTWTVWQWSSTGRVPGIEFNVDMNRMAGGLDTLHRLASDSFGVAPVGSLDAVTPVAPNKVRVAGWSLDPDGRTVTNDVHVYVGKAGYVVETDVVRNDVNRLFHAEGPHGFSRDLPLPPGRHRVCAYGMNAVGGGGTSLLGCRDVGADPFGSLSVASTGRSGEVAVSGWAADPDSSSSVPVHIYVGGRGTAVVADAPSSGAPAGFGGNRGFDVVLPAPSGRVEVCVAALNVAGTPGATTWLGCRQVNVASGDPLGSLDAVTWVGPRRVAVTGWAFDPDVPGDDVAVHIYANGVGKAISAGVSRPDVGARFGSAAASSGFGTELLVSAGRVDVCVAAINAAGTGGVTRWLGCRTVNVPSGSPMGSVDLVAGGSGSVTVGGWAFDPDSSSAVELHVYVGSSGHRVVADRPRGDVSRVFGWKLASGFHAVLPATPGTHDVCVAAINAAGTGGDTRWLACRPVTVR